MSTIELTADRRSALERYLQLDLSPESSCAQDLYRRVEREARSPELALTGDGDSGSLCGKITPAMNAWLADHVARLRQGALASVESLAARIRLPGGVQGMVGKIEEDRLDRNRAQRRAQEQLGYYERNQAKLSEAAQAEQEYVSCRVYEGGREAQCPSLLVDLLVPAAITVPEFFMNYVSFTKLAGVPAIGFGLSAVVAIAVALSAFMAGTFFKAYSFFMTSDRDERRSRGLRQIGIASGMLLVALAAVAYARYHMVLEQWEAAKVIGLPLPNIAALTLGLLAGNVLVFALGAGITFMLHDENPEYARKAKRHRELQALTAQLKRKQLDHRLRQIESGHMQEKDKVRGLERLMDAQPDNRLLDEMMAEIAGKDSEVTGLLNNYRSMLVDEIGRRDPDFVFRGSAQDRYAGQAGEGLSLAEFNAHSLHLYRSN